MYKTTNNFFFNVNQVYFVCNYKDKSSDLVMIRMDDKTLVKRFKTKTEVKKFSHKNFFSKILQKDGRKSFTLKLITYNLCFRKIYFICQYACQKCWLQYCMTF